MGSEARAVFHIAPLKSFIRKHSVATFVALAFLFSYGLGFPALWAVAVFGTRLPTIASTYLGRLLVALGPALAAFVLIVVTRGSLGVSSWLSGLRVRPRDLVLLLVIPAATFSVTIVAYRLTGTPTEQLRTAIERGWPVLITHYLLQTTVIGVGEELGWRGWMLPTLLQKHSYAAATTLVAVVWCLWHMPKLAVGGSLAASFAVVVIALSFLYTVLWVSTGKSVLAVALAHGSVNAPVVFFEGTIGGQATQNAWYVTCGFYAVTALLTVVLRWRWWRQSDTAIRASAPAA